MEKVFNILYEKLHEATANCKACAELDDKHSLKEWLNTKNQFEKAIKILQVERETDSTNKGSKEVCGTCDKYNNCRKVLSYDSPICKIYKKQTE